jgi:hypothetical protein
MRPYQLNPLPIVYLVAPDRRVTSVDRRLDLGAILRSLKSNK